MAPCASVGADNGISSQGGGPVKAGISLMPGGFWVIDENVGMPSVMSKAVTTSMLVFCWGGDTLFKRFTINK